MHPVANIRGSASGHLAGRRIVLAVSGSIAAVKTVELARELIRHGAEVHAVMSQAATGILHPDALHFGTGNPVITRLSGAVEHVALLGDVPEKADLLLVAPATANTISKMALGIDDSVVTTCATVAFGTKTPVIVAPAMHEAMLHHPAIPDHVATLQGRGVTFVEPKHEEKKAKLADVEAVVEAVIHRLATGPLVGRRVLVVTGATQERVDAVRVLTNRSSGRMGALLATELARRGADVHVWQGRTEHPVEGATTFTSHDDLLALAAKARDFDAVWMPAAIGDHAPAANETKQPSGSEWTLRLLPLEKVAAVLRARLPEATLVLFKTETEDLEARAKKRRDETGAQWIVANDASAMGAEETRVLVLGRRETTLEGSKASIVGRLVEFIA